MAPASRPGAHRSVGPDARRQAPCLPTPTVEEEMLKKAAKGFTLIELMIVVAIIGILAAIAIPNFIKYQLRSKFSEASSNIEGLRKANEVLVQGERKLAGIDEGTYQPGTYWNFGATTLPSSCTVGTKKMNWDTTALNAAHLGDWTVEGATYFCYGVATGCKGTGITATQSGACYAVGADSDIDGDGSVGQVALVKRSLGDAMDATVPRS